MNKVIFFLVYFFAYPVLADNISLKIGFYERDAKKDSEVISDDKPFNMREKFTLVFEDEDGGHRGVIVEKSNSDKKQQHIARVTIPKGEDKIFDYKEGKKVKLKVLSDRWKIVSPAGGEMFSPENIDNEVMVVFERVYQIYTVQAISTKNETEASYLRDNIKKDIGSLRKYINKSSEGCDKNLNIYIEKYMAFNMPNNGFDYKVKIGEFEDKACAEKLRDRLIGQYSQEYGFFVTLKDHK